MLLPRKQEALPLSRRPLLSNTLLQNHSSCRRSKKQAKWSTRPRNSARASVRCLTTHKRPRNTTQQKMKQSLGRYVKQAEMEPVFELLVISKCDLSQQRCCRPHPILGVSNFKSSNTASALQEGSRVGEYLLMPLLPGPQVNSSCPSSLHSSARQRPHTSFRSFPRQARHSPEAPPPRCPPNHRSFQSQRGTITKSQCEICHCYECESRSKGDGREGGGESRGGGVFH